METQEIESRIKKASATAVVNHFTCVGKDKDTIKAAHASYTKQASRRLEKYKDMEKALVSAE